MVAPQYLRRRAPKGEPLSIIVINKSKIVSARYAICTFKTPQLTENVREAKNKESPTNLELVRNIHTKGVNRSTHRGRWCNQWVWVERQILCDNDSNSWFIFFNSWKLRKSLQRKGRTRQARNRWNRYSGDASGEISTPPGQFQIGKLGCTVAVKNI